MTTQSRLFVFGVWLFVACSFAHAVVPISVFPDPAQFGTVPENSSSTLFFYLTNSTADPVTVTGMTISGANSAQFDFVGTNCIGSIPAYQTCDMEMTFTPNSISSFAATLQISVAGLKQPIIIPLQGAGGNPTPTITSLSPASVYVNSPGITLTVNGTNFISGSVVYMDNEALPTTYVSATKLTALVPASLLTETNSQFVVVVNPAPGGESGFAYLYVVELDPSIGSATPNTIVAGTAPSPIVVNGGNFMSGASILWNGKSLPTTYISSSQLQATPTAAELAGASIAQLSVSNPAPGGISADMPFDVTYPAKVTVLNLPANDLVWDPYAQRIYASVPSSYGSQGNTIAVINPALGRVSGYFFAGSEPNQLALSSDSKYLYAGLNGNGSVQRLILPNFTPDIDVSLGTNDFGDLNTAIGIQVYPADSHSYAVAEGSSGCCGGTGVYFYKDSTQLPDSITYPDFTDIVFANSTTMYGYEDGTVGQIAVGSSGGTAGTEWSGLVEGNTIQYAGGLIYGSAGEAFDPTTGLLVGSYDVSGSNCCASVQLLPDSTIGRVFVLGVTPFFNQFGITSYNLAKFTPIAVANLSQISVGTTVAFIPWGNNGLAFINQSGCCGTTTSQVILVQSPSMLLTAGGAKNPPPVAQSLFPGSATHGSWNFPLTVKGTGFVPGSQVTWNGTALASSYVSATQLTVYVPASEVAAAGAAQIVITNPAPGGGTSGSLSFSVN